MAHARHVPVVQCLPVRQAQGSEVGVLLEEDEVPTKTELHGLQLEKFYSQINDNVATIH